MLIVSPCKWHFQAVGQIQLNYSTLLHVPEVNPSINLWTGSIDNFLNKFQHTAQSVTSMKSLHCLQIC